MDHLVYVCCRRATLVRACALSLACLLACGTQSVLSGKENLCFSPERDERGLRESATMIKGKQTGAGTKHNEIIRDAVAVVVWLFSAPPFHSVPPAALRLHCASIFKIEASSQVRMNVGEALVIQMRLTNKSFASHNHPPSRPRSGRWGVIGGDDHMPLRC